MEIFIIEQNNYDTIRDTIRIKDPILYLIQCLTWGPRMSWKEKFRKLAHGFKVLGTNISASIAINQKKATLKRSLLSRFKSRQLDEIGSRIGVSLSKARTKDAKISILTQYLSFEDVVGLAKRYKIQYRDIVDELERFKADIESKRAIVKTESEIENIIKVIGDFKPEPVRDEEDLEKQLYQYIRAKLSDVPVKRQVKVGDLRIDMQVGPCGVELKIPKSATHLQRLLGQIRDYGEYFKCMIAVILDAGIVRGLDRYTQRLADLGYVPIIIKGKLKK